MNIYIVYEISLWPFKQTVDFTLGNSLFGAVQLTKNADFHKYKYSRHDIEFDASRSFLLLDGSGLGKSVTIFGADVRSSVHVNDNKKRNLSSR